MRSTIIATILATVLPLAANAQSYRAVNSMDVVPLGQSTFEVIRSGGMGPRGVWCAAADYAENRLGTRGRIYISQGSAPSRSVAGQKSVVFTTDAASLSQAPSKSLTLSMTKVGVGLPVDHAIQFCRPDDYEPGISR
ncbi:hypothetical protein GGR95_000588 [Sulfitobacter undariae]|uniref:Uncharacterized protein n=1 Tax=Sulfitobacter undariae TaxID=1563671 RepID=A0A7W6E812_9RHOB|nr:hypothetical protein [Sulfitobacter undariae]MBB3992969.1 hypothetical protein [Sulfitobacter undariae]